MTGQPTCSDGKINIELQYAGPAVIQEFGSTTVVFPGWAIRVDAYGNLLMERER